MIHFILAAALSLESVMTKEEQKETGVAKLNIQERAALRDWIEDHYTKKMVAQKSTAPILQEVLKGGRFVRLSDSSLWEIEPGDTPITQSWITPTEIKIGQSTDTQYPYTLTNHLTGSTVKARKAQKVTP